MAREIFCRGEKVLAAEYIPETDDRAVYDCWNLPETQKGYNFIRECSFEDFCRLPVWARFRG